MTKFYYFSKSRDAKPGKGSQEELSQGEDYFELENIPDWRKVLSNFYIFPIKIDGLTFNSVEHYYQGSKFRKNNPQFFYLFSAESNSEISKDPAKAKSAGGKSGGKFRPKSVMIDPDFFPNRGKKDMLRALYEKFSTVGLPVRVLLATQNAELWHGTRGVPKSRQFNLEEIRRCIRDELV